MSVRKSNFELLRIIAMMMVIMWHFIVRCIINTVYGVQISVYQCDINGLGGNIALQFFMYRSKPFCPYIRLLEYKVDC